jgi:hypothetical protein
MVPKGWVIAVLAASMLCNLLTVIWVASRYQVCGELIWGGKVPCGVKP